MQNIFQYLCAFALSWVYLLLEKRTINLSLSLHLSGKFQCTHHYIRTLMEGTDYHRFGFHHCWYFEGWRKGCFLLFVRGCCYYKDLGKLKEIPVKGGLLRRDLDMSAWSHLWMLHYFCPLHFLCVVWPEIDHHHPKSYNMYCSVRKAYTKEFPSPRKFRL